MVLLKEQQRLIMLLMKTSFSNFFVREEDDFTDIQLSINSMPLLSYHPYRRMYIGPISFRTIRLFLFVQVLDTF